MMRTRLVWLGILLIGVLALAGCASSSSNFPVINSDSDLQADGDSVDSDGSSNDGDSVEGDGESGSETDSDSSSEPGLRFRDAESDWTLTYADDSNSELAGVQTDLVVATTGMPSGTAVSLTVQTAAASQTYRVATAGDGLATFKSVTLGDGANTLVANANPDSGLVTAIAALTVTSCTVSFVTPTAGAALSDHNSESDCTTHCGDDLDCTQPNLQYNVTVKTENVPDATTVTLNVNGVLVTAQVTDNQAVFTSVSLPDGANLPLSASVDMGGGKTCRASQTIAVSLTCSCHLDFDPLPAEAYNGSDEDQDAASDGFQRRYAIHSDNCADGSAVQVNLDGYTTSLTLTDGVANADVTFTEANHVLSAQIIEAGTGRLGSAGPYAILVDRTAPSVLTLSDQNGTLTDGYVYTKADDLDLDLADGIQIQIVGAVQGVENDEPVTVLLDGRTQTFTTAVLVQNERFVIPNLTLPKPAAGRKNADFALVIRIRDKAGNVNEISRTLHASFDEPTLTLTSLAGRAPTADMTLNAADDNDPAGGLQTTLVAATHNVAAGLTGLLQVDSGTPLSAVVAADGTLTWSLSLTNGAHTLKASVALSASLTVQATALPITVAWEKPSLDFVDPQGDGTYLTDNAWFHTASGKVMLASDAGTGQAVSLTLNDAAGGSPVALDANGHAVFDVTFATRKYDTNTLVASVTNAAGNTATRTIHVYRDVSAPSLAVTVEGAPTITTATNITVHVTVTDDALTALDGASVTLELFDGSDHSQGTNTVTLGANGTASYVYSYLADGTYYVTARLTDRAGNAGTGRADFTVDTPCYQVSITSPAADIAYGPSQAAGGNTAHGVCVPVTVSSADAPNLSTAAKLYLDGGTTVRAVCTLSGGTCSFTDTACSGYGLTGVNMLEGDHTFRVVLEDGTYSCPSNTQSLSVDFTAPTLVMTTPFAESATTMVFNKASADSDPTSAFGSAFSFTASSRESGRTVTLTVANGATTVGTYTTTVDADGKVAFSNVTLTGTGYAEGTTLTLTASLSDRAGNSVSKTYTALVDVTPPVFGTPTPAGGTLNRSDDYNPGTSSVFDLHMTIPVTGGVAGAGKVAVTITPDGGIATTPSGSPFALSAGGIATIDLTLTAGSYTLALSTTDSHGNTATTTVYYTINFASEIHLYDTSFEPLEGKTATWLYDADLDKNTAGFQASFIGYAIGLDNGAEVRLCSDAGRADGLAPYGYCTKNASYVIVAKSTIAVTGGTAIASFSGVSLANEKLHHLYVESTDAASKTISSLSYGLANLTLDSLRPSVAAGGIQIASNQAANDTNASASVVLNASEGTPVAGGGLKVNIDVTLTAGQTDGKDADLYLNGVSLTGGVPVAVQNVSGAYKASFTNITLPEGAGTIIARLHDVNGNTSNDNDANGKLTVLVDTLAPTLSFVDTTGLLLKQSTCNGNDVSGNCLYTVSVKVAKKAGEASSQVGTKVTLSIGSTNVTQTINTDGSSVTLDFANFPLPQGSDTVTVTATDAVGNTATPVTLDYTVDSLAPTISLTAPSASAVTYAASDNDDTTCGSGGGLSDLKLRRCDWAIAASGVNRSTTVEVQWRYQGEEAFRTFSNSGATWVTSTDGGHAIGALDFTRDANPSVIEVRLFATETGTGNTFASDVVSTVTLNFTPSYFFQLYAVKNDSSTKLLSGNDVLNAAYGDATTTDNVFNATLRISVSTDLVGKTLSYTLNGGTAQTVSLAAATTDFSVPFVEGPTLNTLHLDVESLVTNDYANILADSKAPSVSFTTPAVGSVVMMTASMDTDGTQGNGVSPSGANAPSVSSGGIENGQVATLTATDGSGAAVTLGGTATATFSGGVATFSAVRLPNTASLSGDVLNLSVTVKDLAGNAATLTGGQPQVRVDDDPPADVTNLVACIGESTGTSDPDLEPAACSTACGGDTSKCHRRAGTVLLTWTVPSANTTGASAVPVDYDVRWMLKEDGSAPCSSIDFATATSVPASASLTLTPLAAVGGTQSGVLTGLTVNTESRYCFWVRAVDRVGNKSGTSGLPKVARGVNLMTTTLESSLSGVSSMGSLGAVMRWADLNGDGKEDLILSDSFGGDSMNGRVYVYYGQAAWPSAPTTADTGYAQRLEGGANDYFGNGLAVGDVNGDGKPDIVVGAPGVAPVYDGIGTGAAYLYFGQASKSVHATPDVTLSPDTSEAAHQLGDYFGWQVAVLNYDQSGPKDVFVGTLYDLSGDIYEYAGRADWSAITSGQAQHQNSLLIQRNTASSVYPDKMGFSLSAADLNGDGKDGLVFSQLDYNDDGADRAWVLTGGTAGSLITLDDAADFTALACPHTNYASDWGSGVFGLPSTGSYTHDELMILDGGGKTLYYYPDIAAYPPASQTVFSIYTTYDSSYLAPIPATVGDFNGDGYGDVVITGTNQVRIYWGSATGLSTTRYTQLGAFGESGYRAAGGDYNGDGKPDIAIINTATGKLVVVY